MNKNINSQNIKNLKPDTIDWTQVQTEMKSKLGPEVFDSWLRKISFLQEFNNYLLLSVPTRFIRDWITSRYLDQILKIVKIYKKNIIRVEFKIVDQKDNFEDVKVLKNAVETRENISFIKDSHLQYNRIDPNKRFDNFITGSSNKLAFEA